MATFSPSPAPRRSARLRHVPVSPGNAKIPVNNSRLGTPINASDNGSFINESRASVDSAMDIDDRNSLSSDKTTVRSTGVSYLAKSEQLAVSFYANLPTEVLLVLKHADFYGGTYTGGIDTLTGFALVASKQTCYVWQHSQAIRGTPTCYIFRCPEDSNQTSPPFYGLIPYSSYSTAREPGLILMSPAGEIRMWDSIGIGLAGGDHFSSVTLSLSPDELVTNLVRVDPQTYIASTTSGVLFRLTLTYSGGNLRLASHTFARPASSLSLSRLYSSFFVSSGSKTPLISEPGNISALALGRATVDGGEIWALIDTRIQLWELKAEGWEDIIRDDEVSEIIRAALRDAFGNSVEQDDANVDLELLDIAVDRQGRLVVLLSYAGGEEEHIYMNMDTSGIRRIYSLIHLTLSNDAFTVDSVRSVPYQSTSSSGAPMHPRLQLIQDGKLVVIQFGDAIALCATESEYKDRLELKSKADRTLGVGITHSDSAVLILTAATMMKVHIDMDRVKTVNAQTGPVNSIKSVMTQAVLYGSLTNNPLTFTFPPDVDEESLMRGAEQLSQAILQSDPILVQRNHDLSAHLTSRKERLSFLIHFINDNAVLGKISQRSRQNLATDAEKLYASHQLWVQHNDFLSTSHPSHSVLHDTVLSYMNDIQEGHHEDVIRTFFRIRIADIGVLIQRIPDITLKLAQATGGNTGGFIAEANRIVLTVLRSAFDYREYNKGVYGIDPPMINPWTSDVNVINVVQGLFDATTRLVESVIAGAGRAITEDETTEQLPELAAILFACMQERLDYLSRSEETGVEQERSILLNTFTHLRPEVLETLRKNGHATAAFSLAEKYRDFASLAALCHREVVYPPEQNPNAPRIQNYIELYKDEFATELYRWYIQHGELRVLFSLSDSHTGYMDKFFADNANPLISWIHDLGHGRYAAAARALLVESGEATNLASKQLMLSIGKLSHLAHEQETLAPSDEDISDAFHDGLDFVSVHESLLEEFNAVLETLKGRQSLDSQTNAIIKQKASRLSDRPALTRIFKDLVRNVLQGKVLSVEDAVDVLSLKDNNETLGDFAMALHLLAGVQNIPRARKTSAFRTVWRRIYIHDDWNTIRQTANVSDSELSERFRSTALYATFCHILTQTDQPDGYETIPDVSLIIPTADEVSSRWPGMPADEVESIVQDYIFECDTLGDLELNDVYYRIRELAEQDLEEAHI
ncbi:Non-repetitive/WGA-negative nucleoporin C-terminal-domain-containing protein [Desarmillaria tabescens]|uniref:Non-repetitive/WGA-negative nucleoporin C-terminal-domain-containing protein n=1 Tax=Armillaria tabescens TaxID=1929756 RepID=A0AA39U398_ARMTA|nr:Non-repetitive/WGA-negative nucleoporin C-terminal-domain-containing protein [Desarmillaria tabescens]KAK0469814.1 Non-repetitive/WGA-negative nucleoporin C-terminal-domain-containing protein [Desarmillaria tabescens]